MLMLERPLSHYWTSPLKPQDSLGDSTIFFLDFQKVQEIIRNTIDLPTIVFDIL